MLISRRELRLALTAGLGNAFGSLSALPFGFYVPLAVLAVGSDSYGGSLELGRQRILGSTLGSLLLVVCYGSLNDLPMPLALAITLAALRLLGGLLGLQVGYKVGGLIIVMGWFVHEGQLAAWIPLRLIWTCFGVVLALLSLRLFWPSRSLDQSLSGYASLLEALAAIYGELADRLDPAGAAPTGAVIAPPAESALPPALGQDRYRALRSQLVSLRRQLPALARELGTNPQRHPAHQLLKAFEEASSRLITALGALLRQRPPRDDQGLLEALHRQEAELLRGLVERLEIWRRILRQRGQPLPPPPPPPAAVAGWQRLADDLSDPQINEASLEGLERLASRLLLCRQAQQAMQDAERQWASLVGRPQGWGRLAHQRSSR